MRTDQTVRCPTCDVRLSVRAERCPNCAARTVAAGDPKIVFRPRRPSDRAGRWVRWLVFVLLTLALFALALSVPVAFVAAMFSPHPVAGVLAATIAVGSLALVFALVCFALMIATPFVWLAIVPFAILFGSGAPAMRWVSPRSEPSPRGRPLAHRVLGFSKWLERVSQPASKEFSTGVTGFGALVVLGLVVAGVVHALRGIPFGDVEDVVSASIGLVCALAVSSFGFFGLRMLFSPLVEWVVSRPGLHEPALQTPDDARLFAEEARRGIRLEGVVRAAGPLLRSPGSGAACVAVRLRGVTRGARVDDALVVPFELETPDGPVRVTGSDVLVAFEPGPAEHPATGEWLQARGLKPSEGPSLGEALVRPGDRIVVWGRAEEGLKQGGYRGAQETRIVALDDAEGPLLLEPAES
ncbi:MAG: hypothetical protein H6722_30730 [Sandaracinus sp.]|nr:hypothetical protein [Sandaracinus sp.]